MDVLRLIFAFMISIFKEPPMMKEAAVLIASFCRLAILAELLDWAKEEYLVFLKEEGEFPFLFFGKREKRRIHICH